MRPTDAMCSCGRRPALRAAEARAVPLDDALAEFVAAHKQLGHRPTLICVRPKVAAERGQLQ